MCNVFIIKLLISCNVNAQLEPKGTEIIAKKYYSFEYSEDHEQTLWVYYLITKSHLKEEAKRKDNFHEDTLIKTGSAGLSDYKYSGFDRGHMCPAAVMKFDQDAMNETFSLANISPQDPNLNRRM